jgi:tRNA A-37 threonylcarbamoyl transferase component Bud32
LDELWLSSARGTLRAVGARADVVRAAAEIVLRDDDDGLEAIGRVDLPGMRAWFKRSRLHGRSRIRWTIKHAFGARLPRVREHDNLTWLGARGFQVPEPLAAGWLARLGAPRRQFLFTRDVPDAVALEVVLRDGGHEDRAALLDELARETARMHALQFVHHDLYTRNLLVRPRGHERRIVFLDAWAGGPRPQVRADAYDLACLFLRADRELSPTEVERFMETYARARAAHGRPVDAGRILAHAKRIRARLVQRLIARPHERRGECTPRLEG